MRVLLFLLLAAAASAQSHLELQDSHTTESLRGVSAVSATIAWASGSHGTYLRTVDGGKTWIPKLVPDADKLDFRGVVAFSADEAFLLSSGPGDQSRIYHTSDGGQHWQLEFTNKNPKGFFDSIAFWDPKHGIVLGDPIPDDAGKLHFELLETDDGATWHPMQTSGMPDAIEGEGAFAASNSCIAILRDSRKAHVSGNIWFATGGKVARVFHSPDAGRHWEAFDTPIVHGPESAGIFSITFRNDLDGVIAGGDYKQPTADGPNLAFTRDGGKTWQLATFHPQAYFSAVTYSRKGAVIVAQDSVTVARSASGARRLAATHKREGAFNAISMSTKGDALIVGAKGVIAKIH